VKQNQLGVYVNTITRFRYSTRRMIVRQCMWFKRSLGLKRASHGLNCAMQRVCLARVTLRWIHDLHARWPIATGREVYDNNCTAWLIIKYIQRTLPLTLWSYC